MVEYLKIGKEKHPVRLGYYVMKKVKEETGKSLSQAMEDSKKNEDISVHETILYAGLQMGAFAEGTEMNFKREEMEMVLDLCFNEYLKLFQSDKFFPSEKDVKDLEDRLGELEEKEKQSGNEEGEKKKEVKRTKKK